MSTTDAKEFVMSLPVKYVIAFTKRAYSKHPNTIYYSGTGKNWTWLRAEAVTFATRQLAEWQNTALPEPETNCIIAFFR